LSLLGKHKTVVMSGVPTVENLTSLAFATLGPVFEQRFLGRVHLKRVRIYETPTCWAEVSAQRTTRTLAVAP
jgi:6-pyruvoyltetrahydropterin/6-carboxytetrahydropterin synthase